MSLSARTISFATLALAVATNAFAGPRPAGAASRRRSRRTGWCCGRGALCVLLFGFRLADGQAPVERQGCKRDVDAFAVTMCPSRAYSRPMRLCRLLPLQHRRRSRVCSFGSVLCSVLPLVIRLRLSWPVGGFWRPRFLCRRRTQATATRERSEWSGQPIAGGRNRAHTPTVPAAWLSR